MNKIALSVTFAFLLVTPLLTQPLPAHSDAANAADPSAEPLLHNTSVDPSSNDVTDRIARLRKFGSRFEKVIRQIELEVAKPEWQFEEQDNQKVSF